MTGRAISARSCSDELHSAREASTPPSIRLVAHQPTIATAKVGGTDLSLGYWEEHRRWRYQK